MYPTGHLSAVKAIRPANNESKTDERGAQAAGFIRRVFVSANEAAAYGRVHGTPLDDPPLTVPVKGSRQGQAAVAQAMDAMARAMDAPARPPSAAVWVNEQITGKALRNHHGPASGRCPNAR
jgi:hypothetical protein